MIEIIIFFSIFFFFFRSLNENIENNRFVVARFLQIFFFLQYIHGYE